VCPEVGLRFGVDEGYSFREWFEFPMGELKPADLPLLTHLTDIVVRGAGLDVPFDNFSDTSISSSVPKGRPTQEVQQ
jgi:hypothetical protein